MLLTSQLIFGKGLFASDDASPIKSTQCYKRIKAAIDKIRVVDSHEHLKAENLTTTNPPDVFNIIVNNYVASDIKAMSNFAKQNKDYLNRSLSMEKRWQAFEPIYEKIKNTGYMRCVRIGIKKVHGIDLKDADSAIKINESIKRLYKPGLYKKVLYEQGGIDYVINYIHKTQKFDKTGYPDFFRLVPVIDDKTEFTNPQDVNLLEKEYGASIKTIDDLKEVYNKVIAAYIANGAVGFKCMAAYSRSINFPDYPKKQAEQILQKLITAEKGEEKVTLSPQEQENLTNYCMNLMLNVIAEHDKPISFHTGFLSGSHKDVRRSNPQYLIGLLERHRNLNFDIFHGGWPYTQEFIEIGKSWSNAYLNLCWLHIISPEGARRQLSEMLECVPINKIFAFGGDFGYPELTIGHLEMARENCAIVLAEKVLNGYFTEDEAIEYANRILRTNSIEFFRLEDTGSKATSN